MLDPSSLAHRILIVDDDQNTHETLRDVLQSRGHNVMLAKERGQAHSAFHRHGPDFVILDLILLGEHGFELCERFKQYAPTVPVMILTAIDRQDARELADRSGADGYFTKPFEIDVLLERIQQIAQMVWNETRAAREGAGERVRCNCHCGKRFKVSPVHRGRTMTCPRCGDTLIVPRQTRPVNG